MSSAPDKLATRIPDEAEPTAGAGTAPLWLVVVFGLLFYWGQLYLDQHAGGFHRQVYQPYESFKMVQGLQPKSAGDELFTRGARVFDMNCAVCHQATGKGDANRGIPPLAGSDWVQVDGANRKIRIVLNGFAGPVKVLGQDYNNAMPAFRDVLTSDEDIAGVLTYVRGNKEWGNNFSPVAPEQVKSIRAATQDRGPSWSADELLQIPVKD